MSVRRELGDDPYSSVSGVQFLDQQLDSLDGRLTRISAQTDKLSSLQIAAWELIPASSSLAKSIRQLIGEGYLLSASVLFRPLIERVATLSYLAHNPAALVLWRSGWPHGKRPSLRTRLATLIPGANDDVIKEFVAAVSKYNSLVHGDPLAALQNVLSVSEVGREYAIDRDYLSPGRAHYIAFEAGLAIVFLSVEIDSIFPAIGAKG
ncbi:hypothetical protein [Thermomonospora echinospora]|uniref:hypothetical protein n=1 Tax=Thermomonospora echinospora TaxID=1992 RepID=UPI0011AFF465|nr:hypothetical protein [Thermomonospora echinospora]